MRLIAFTIELGEAPTHEQLAAVARAANAPSISVVTSDTCATIIGPPEAVTAASVAAAHAARTAGAQIRCRVEPLGDATAECAQQVAAAVREGVTQPPAPQHAATAMSEAATLDGSTVHAQPSAGEIDPLASGRPLLDALSAVAATPAGGSATAAVAAMAAAIVVMASRVTLRDDRYSDVHDDTREMLAKAEALRDELHVLVQKDAVAYASFMQASGLPANTEAETEARRLALKPVALAACEVPLEVMRRSQSVLELCARLARRGSRNTRPDVAVAATIAGASARGAWINVRVNLPAVRDLETRSRLSGEASTIARLAEETERHTLRASEVDAD